MALVIIDLDNTLLDRTSAFAHWAQQFVAANSLNHNLLGTFEGFDDDGLRPRPEFYDLVAGVTERVSKENVAADYETHYPSSFHLDGGIKGALQATRTVGHTIGIATNGPEFQEDVITRSGLAELVDGSVISEVVGYRKPDRRVAEILAAQLDQPLTGGAVIGDGVVDIELAHNLELPSAWIHRNRAWGEAGFTPSAVHAKTAAAIYWALQELEPAG